MTIIRSEKGIDNPYTPILRSPFENKNLSWEARGLLAYLLVKPDTWELRVNDLINKGPAGRDKVRRMVKELQEAGHIVRRRYQDPETKQFRWVSEIHERAIDGFSGYWSIFPWNLP